MFKYSHSVSFYAISLQLLEGRNVKIVKITVNVKITAMHQSRCLNYELISQHP